MKLNRSLELVVVDKFQVVQLICNHFYGDTNDEIDLVNEMCACKKCDIHRILCSHAIAIDGYQGIYVHSLVDKKYTMKCYITTYFEPIFLTNDHGEWDVPKKKKFWLINLFVPRKKTCR